jgi:hypothetical protein
MAWRPNEYVIEGMLSNTEPNKITGHITFAGIGKVIFNLKGNFHRDIRGAAIKFVGDCGNDVNVEQAKQYLQSFALKQTGKAGDITAGREPIDYSNVPYIEWYGKKNGRVVIELDYEQVEIIGQPIPAIESDPIDRAAQNELMSDFVMDLAEAIKKPKSRRKK